MKMSHRSALLLLLLLLLPSVLAGAVSACGDGGDSADVVDASGDTQALDASGDTQAADASAPDPGDIVGSGDATLGDSAAADSAGTQDTAAVEQTLDAAEYCETTVQMFCDYYLRCGRMAVPDVATCLTVFTEVCNAVYEPVYAALASEGRLRLSSGGVAACADHLATVECAQQPNDLDGGCAEMWVGGVDDAGLCSYGIESLVCTRETTCVLGLDFCGTCQTYAQVGEACALPEVRCHANARCVDGACRARGQVGESCTEAIGCLPGVPCAEGVCAAPQIVSVGAACDQLRRCQYKAACVSGACVETALLGEPCSATKPCASGVCQSQRCVLAGSLGRSGCLAE